MRRTWLVIAVLSVVAGSLPSTAAGAKSGRAATRSVDVRYDDSGLQYVPCAACPTVAARRGERYVTVEVIDDVSPSGYVDITWEEEGHGYFAVCGRTSEPQKIPAGAVVTVWPWTHPGSDCPTSFSTSGTVKLTFSRNA